MLLFLRHTAAPTICPGLLLWESVDPSPPLSGRSSPVWPKREMHCFIEDSSAVVVFLSDSEWLQVGQQLKIPATQLQQGGEVVVAIRSMTNCLNCVTEELEEEFPRQSAAMAYDEFSPLFSRLESRTPANAALSPRSSSRGTWNAL